MEFQFLCVALLALVIKDILLLSRKHNVVCDYWVIRFVKITNPFDLRHILISKQLQLRAVAINKPLKTSAFHYIIIIKSNKRKPEWMKGSCTKPTAKFQQNKELETIIESLRLRTIITWRNFKSFNLFEYSLHLSYETSDKIHFNSTLFALHHTGKTNWKA